MGNRLDRANDFIGKWMPLIMPLCVVTGFLLDYRLAFLKRSISILFAIACFTSSLTISFSDFRKSLNLKALVTLIVAGHVILPAIACLLFRLVVDPGTDIYAGLMLIFAGPCATTSYIWSSMYGGNKGLSIFFVVVDTLLSLFLTPLIMRLTCSTAVSMDSVAMVWSMVKMVVLPSIAGMVVVSVVKKERISKVSSGIKLGTRLLLLLIIPVSISGSKSAVVESFNPSYLWSMLVVVVVLVLGYAIGFAGNRFILRSDLSDSISLAFGLGCRNVGLAIIMAGSYFSPLATLPPVICLFFHDVVTAGMGRLFLEMKSKENRLMEESNAASCDRQIQ